MAAVGSSSTPYPFTRLSDRFGVYAVPMFDDNYGWLIVDATTGRCAAVDPGDAAPILKAVRALGLTLTTVLITHKHGDHTGGTLALKAAVPACGSSAPPTSPSPAATWPRRTGMPSPSSATRRRGTPAPSSGRRSSRPRATQAATSCSTWCPPGPTRRPRSFCGDTLFVGGCGRFFEGTAAQMHANLTARLAALPDHTLAFCAHEYTASNLQFALQVEPDNAALRAKALWAAEQRREGGRRSHRPSGEERAYNPFVRCALPHVMARVGARDAVDSIAAAARRQEPRRL
eukprot:TRINITY_DN14741_c0_g1_i1.p2 TRINITY_DN14741_c0_g1~~TRINITY_DN14741_c0_g1_i1.p2  ORF type:complete len:296 (-),score=62.32 TRINITY_DN14741_c0_g1_i1:79-942(-)